jgi:hypothetical protein
MRSLTVERQSCHIEQKGDSNFVKACGVIGAITSNILTGVTCYSGYKYFFPSAPVPVPVPAPNGSVTVNHITVNHITVNECCHVPTNSCSMSSSDDGLFNFLFAVVIAPTYFGWEGGRYIGSKLEGCASIFLGDSSTHNE